MKTCENCYWAEQCEDAGKRCEYYDPIIGGENIVRREYEEALKERVEDYNDIVREQQEDYYGD